MINFYHFLREYPRFKWIMFERIHYFCDEPNHLSYSLYQCFSHYMSSFLWCLQDLGVITFEESDYIYDYASRLMVLSSLRFEVKLSSIDQHFDLSDDPNDYDYKYDGDWFGGDE